MSKPGHSEPKCISKYDNILLCIKFAGLQAILHCLDSTQPEIAQGALDKVPDLIVGMQEHATCILMRVFDLGIKSRQPVEQCIAKCVININMQKGS